MSAAAAASIRGKTPDELVAVGDRIGLDGAALAKASRLVAKVDSAAVQDGFELYLHGFIVADDGSWVVVQQGMNEDLRQARRYHWLSAGPEELRRRAACGDRGRRPGQHRQPHRPPRRGVAARPARPAAVARAPTASRASCRGSKGEGSARSPLPDEQLSLPHLIMPAHHDVRAEDVIARRLNGNLAAAAESRPGRFFRTAAGAGRRRTHGAGARHGVGGGARRAVPLQRSGALFLRAWRQGPAPVSGADRGLRRDHPGHEVGGRRTPSSAATRSWRRSGGWTTRRARWSGTRPARRSTS